MAAWENKGQHFFCLSSLTRGSRPQGIKMKVWIFFKVFLLGLRSSSSLSSIIFPIFAKFFLFLPVGWTEPVRGLEECWVQTKVESKKFKELKKGNRRTDGQTERLSFRWFSFYIIRVSRCELLFVQDEIHYWLQYEPEQYFIRRIWQGEILRWCRELSARTADQQGLQVNRCDCWES